MERGGKGAPNRLLNLSGSKEAKSRHDKQRRKKYLEDGGGGARKKTKAEGGGNEGEDQENRK
jgi:hypothetical protein